MPIDLSRVQHPKDLNSVLSGRDSDISSVLLCLTESDHRFTVTGMVYALFLLPVAVVLHHVAPVPILLSVMMLLISRMLRTHGFVCRLIQRLAAGPQALNKDDKPC